MAESGLRLDTLDLLRVHYVVLPKDGGLVMNAYVKLGFLEEDIGVHAVAR
jgi:hypothetical protein